MMTHQPIARIDSNGKTTEELLGECMIAFNANQRASFLTDAGQGLVVLQRLRMRLSRLRNSMDAKNLPKQHFKLKARVFKYTNSQGQRFDCVVLEKIHTQEHKVFETLERMVKNAEPSRNVEKEPSRLSNKSGVEW